MLQKDVATRLGVDKCSIFNWGSEYLRSGDPVHASHHRFPRVRSSAGGEGLGRAARPVPDHLGDDAEKGVPPAGHRPGHIGEVGVGETGAAGQVLGASESIPPGRGSIGRATREVGHNTVSLIPGYPITWFLSPVRPPVPPLRQLYGSFEFTPTSTRTHCSGFCSGSRPGEHTTRARRQRLVRETVTRSDAI